MVLTVLHTFICVCICQHICNDHVSCDEFELKYPAAHVTWTIANEQQRPANKDVNKCSEDYNCKRKEKTLRATNTYTHTLAHKYCLQNMWLCIRKFSNLLCKSMCVSNNCHLSLENS